MPKELKITNSELLDDGAELADTALDLRPARDAGWRCMSYVKVCYGFSYATPDIAGELSDEALDRPESSKACWRSISAAQPVDESELSDAALDRPESSKACWGVSVRSR